MWNPFKKKTSAETLRLQLEEVKIFMNESPNKHCFFLEEWNNLRLMWGVIPIYTPTPKTNRELRDQLHYYRAIKDSQDDANKSLDLRKDRFDATKSTRFAKHHP